MIEGERLHLGESPTFERVEFLGNGPIIGGPKFFMSFFFLSRDDGPFLQKDRGLKLL